MANLFKPLEKADDDIIRMQIAVLRSVTLKNILAPKAQTAGKKIVRAVNWLMNKLEKNIELDEPKVTEIPERIQENYSTLKHCGRLDLDEFLRDELAERVSNAEFFSDDEKLSNAIIFEAAKNFDDIGQYLTSSQIADTIAQRSYNQIRNKINEELKKQTYFKVNQLENKIDENIAKLSRAEREEMQKVLNVDELTGKTIRKTVLQAGLPAFLLGSTSGLGVYAATTTIMHAIFTTAFGVTLPFAAYTGVMSAISFLTGPIGWALVAGVTFYNVTTGDKKVDRELLAQFIFLAFSHNGRNFAPLENELEKWRSVKIASENKEKKLRDFLEKMEKQNKSQVSPADLDFQVVKLRQEMEKQNKIARDEIEKEFLFKRQQIKQNANKKNEQLERFIIERDELLERQKIESDKRIAELEKKYRETISRHNLAIKQMREEQDILISRLENEHSNLMLRNEEIRQKLHEAVNTAKYEIDIISPWINSHVVDENFISEFCRAINRGVVIKIRYGIGNQNSYYYSVDKKS